MQKAEVIVSVDNPGLVIESFVVAATNHTFGSNHDRHHPVFSWANSEAFQNPAQFEQNRGRVEEVVGGLLHTLYKGQGHNELLNTLGDLQGAVKNSATAQELRQVIDEALKTPLDQILYPKKPPEKQ